MAERLRRGGREGEERWRSRGGTGEGQSTVGAEEGQWRDSKGAAWRVGVWTAEELKRHSGGAEEGRLRSKGGTAEGQRRGGGRAVYV